MPVGRGEVSPVSYENSLDFVISHGSGCGNNQAERLIGLHKTLASIHSLESPYFLALETPENCFELFERGSFRVKIGTVASFSLEDMAFIVESMLVSYSDKAVTTLGCFPKDDPQEWNCLSAAMIDGYANRQLVISVSDRKYKKPIGGCMVVPGSSELSIQEAVGNRRSSLPTLSSLHFVLPQEHPFSSAQEREVACYVRFYRLPEDIISQFSASQGFSNYLRSFSMEVLSGMVRASEHLAQSRGHPFAFGVLDTNDGNVAQTLTKYYAGQVLASETLPTEATLASPHHWHYEQGNSLVILFDHQRQLETALTISESLGEKQFVSVDSSP